MGDENFNTETSSSAVRAFYTVLVVFGIVGWIALIWAVIVWSRE